MFRESQAFSSYSIDDPTQALDFYGRTLGLDISEIPGMEGMLRIRCPGGATVMLYPKPDHEPAAFTVLNFPVKDVDKAVDRLSDQGVCFEHYDREDIRTDAKGIARGDGKGPSVAWFKDPAGNILSVLEEKGLEEKEELVGAGAHGVPKD